jgi:hypothetical protein
MVFAIVMVARYSFSALNISSLMTSTSKAICYVAGVRAILSVGITVGCERLIAMGTQVGIDGFFVHRLGVSVPPGLPALFAAKNRLFPIRFLHQFFSALLTVVFIDGRGGDTRHYTRQIVLPAMGFDRIHGKAKQPCNFLISAPGKA